MLTPGYIGRQGATAPLHLAAVGLSTEARGRLEVNETYLSSLGIYTIPESSMVGETEESLTKQRVAYEL